MRSNNSRHPLTQSLRSPCPAVGKRATLERSDLKSENIGPRVKLRMPNKTKIKKNQGESLRGCCRSRTFCLEVIWRENVRLRDKQMQILKNVIVEKKNVLAVLPTVFGKWLVYQIMPPFADFMDSGFKPTETNSIVLVISPLNAL